MNRIDPSHLLLLPVFILLAYAFTLVVLRRRIASATLFTTLLLLPVHTMLGAIIILQARIRDEPATYLEGLLFRVESDATYATALVAYGLFLFLTVAVIGFAPTCRWARVGRRNDRLVIDHWSRYRHGAAIVMLGLLTMLQAALIKVIGQGGTAYGLVPTEGVVGHVYTYSTIAAVYGLTISMIILWTTARGVPHLGMVLVSYGALALAQVGISLWSGQRRYLMIALIAGLAALVDKGDLGRRPVRTLALIVVGFLGLSGMAVVGAVRGGEANLTAVGKALSAPFSLFEAVAGSSEFFAAHMSLYGVLTAQGQPRVVPFLQSAYPVYIEGVGVHTAQGFTIHQVAGWWLSVGPLAPLAAALTVGLSALAFRRLAVAAPSTLSVGFISAATYLPAAGVPLILLRGDSSSIRGLVLEILVIPGLFASVPFIAARRQAGNSSLDATQQVGNVQTAQVSTLG